jgi:8-oxo-dGTP diphosphatase
MQKTKKCVIASVITKSNTVLIAQRAKKDALYEKWEFPGGKVGLNETAQECFTRELAEEFGIQAQIGDYFCTSFFEHNGQQWEMITYLVSSFTGEFILHDHKQIKWVTIPELAHYDFPEADGPIVDELRALDKV